MVHAVAETRYYPGRYPFVTGVLPGTNPAEEVLVLGHTSEQGAQDNATGVAAMVESLNTIARLVKNGTLPKPHRSIRILLMPELYGSLSYICAHPERTKHTVAAMTVDTPAASYDLSGTEYTFYMNPQVAMSYADALIKRIAAAYFVAHQRPWHWAEHTPGTDSYLGDPLVGIPTVWSYSGTGVVTHHNSEDKPDTVDPRSMHDLITVISTYLYFNAGAGETQVPWLADIALDHVTDEMSASVATAIDGLRSGDADAGSYGLERIDYLRDRGRNALLSVLRLVPNNHQEAAKQSLASQFKQLQLLSESEKQRLQDAGAQPRISKTNLEAQQLIVRRKRPGSLPLDDLPQEQWDGYPSGAWDKRVTVALYWCDGKRTVAEVAHLTEMEMGRTNFDFVGYFRFLQRHGYVEWAR